MFQRKNIEVAIIVACRGNFLKDRTRIFKEKHIQTKVYSISAKANPGKDLFGRSESFDPPPALIPTLFGTCLS